VRPDPVSLVSGTVVAVLGIVLLVDSAGAVDLSLGWMAVALTAAVGAILLLSGLAGNGGRHD
jgi:hypothetical protein